MTQEKIRFAPQDKDYRTRVQQSFDRQQAMKTLGITLENIEPGRIDLAMPYREAFTQQHGFVHAGILSTAMDSACGYAAFSLMPKEAAVLSIEYKINLLAPAQGEFFRITGQVLKPGRTIIVCQSEVFASLKGKEKLVAQMTGTMMAVFGRDGIEG